MSVTSSGFSGTDTLTLAEDITSITGTGGATVTWPTSLLSYMSGWNAINETSLVSPPPFVPTYTAAPMSATITAQSATDTAHTATTAAATATAIAAVNYQGEPAPPGTGPSTAYDSNGTWPAATESANVDATESSITLTETDGSYAASGYFETADITLE